MKGFLTPPQHQFLAIILHSISGNVVLLEVWRILVCVCIQQIIAWTHREGSRRLVVGLEVSLHLNVLNVEMDRGTSLGGCIVESGLLDEVKIVRVWDPRSGVVHLNEADDVVGTGVVDKVVLLSSDMS